MIMIIASWVIIPALVFNISHLIMTKEIRVVENCLADNFINFNQSGTRENSITFCETFGGSRFDYCREVRQTNDGGYIILGDKDGEMWLIKIDQMGNELWNRTFKGSGFSVFQINDGGYIVVGSIEWNMFMVKISHIGDEIWTKTYKGDDFDNWQSIQQTNDGSYIIVGSTSSYGNGKTDMWLIKTDNNGNEIWNKTYGGKKSDIGYSVRVNPDEGYLITGITYSYNTGDESGDAWIIKTDGEGDEIWNVTFTSDSDETVNSIQQTDDGDFIAAGYALTNSDGKYNYDIWVTRADVNGINKWTKTFGGAEEEKGYSIQPTSDGGYVITGHTYSYGAGNRDIWLIKIDSNGNKLWDRTYGGSKHDEGKSVQQTNDGGYIIVGNTESYGNGNPDIWLLKVDSEGRLESANGNGPINGGDPPNGEDENSGSSSKFPWLWIAIGAGAVIIVVIIIIIIRRRNDDDWDGEDDEDDEEDDEEEEDNISLLGKMGKVAPPQQKQCVKCGAILISPDAAFCAACGASQATVSAPAPYQQFVNCPGCGGVNAQGTVFCGMCGMNLRQSLGVAPAAALVQQSNVQQQPVSNQFVQPIQAPTMTTQGYVQQQVSTPAPPPDLPKGYGGLQ